MSSEMLKDLKETTELLEQSVKVLKMVEVQRDGAITMLGKKDEQINSLLKMNESLQEKLKSFIDKEAK